MTTGDLKTTQYGDAQKFSARILIHAKYGTNQTPWPIWLFNQYRFPADAKICEFGCGNGLVWKANAFRLDPCWKITLTDFSSGMVESAKAAIGETPAHIDYRVFDLATDHAEEAAYTNVLANHMLYHIRDRAAAIANLRFCLRPGGELYASTVGEGNMVEMRALMREFTGNNAYAESIGTITDEFSLENGAAQLASCFREVRLVRYEDSLEITDAVDLVNYIYSCNGLKPGVEVLSETERDEFERFVAERIAKTGSFHVTKDSGTFIAG